MESFRNEDEIEASVTFLHRSNISSYDKSCPLKVKKEGQQLPWWGAELKGLHQQTIPRVAPDASESESPIPGASLTVDSEESDNSPFPGELILRRVSCEPPRSSLSSREDVRLRQSVLRGHLSAPSKFGVRGPFAEPSEVFKIPVSILVPRVAREIRGPPMQSPACMVYHYVYEVIHSRDIHASSTARVNFSYINMEGKKEETKKQRLI
ncbi:hypothetical protein J437_LFUL004457 [Ladona fulva]|uniref:Uncharacterized protein n=1 Tax=Ladona fulva TaxID=123851 RepID=A0A8K0NXB7_LADFU|nr:hypothetical protein J437_LFUL004457 [Ladona fulva]